MIHISYHNYYMEATVKNYHFEILIEIYIMKHFKYGLIYYMLSNKLQILTYYLDHFVPIIDHQTIAFLARTSHIRASRSNAYNKRSIDSRCFHFTDIFCEWHNH